MKLPATLVLIRHADRDNSAPELDNGLSQKGMRQAQELAEWGTRWSQLFVPHLNSPQIHSRHDLKFSSSPRLRCRETLDPWMSSSGQSYQIDDRLLEQQWDEGQARWIKRIEKWISEWSQSENPHIICSHGDWIPQALQILGISNLPCRKGSWTEVQQSNGIIYVSSYLDRYS